MLYKKSKEQKLSDELFKNPTSEYRAAPFWAWNCELDKAELLRQIEVLKEMGFGGFHMHSRSGMATNYLSEEFMDLVTACCDKAEAEDMLAYLYDEDRWPSGFAGGIVTKDKRFRQRYLLITVNPIDASDDFDDAYNNGKAYYLTEFNVLLNENGELSEYSVTKDKPKDNETKWYAYIAIESESGWYNNQTYVDTLSKKAIDRFIEVTHEAYKKAVGDRFGKTVPSIFTDEPQLRHKQTLAYAQSRDNVTLPWTMELEKKFTEHYGYNICDKLPELFWDLPEGKISYARYCYHDFVTKLFTESFADNCGKWCRDNGIAFTGHMMNEPTLFSQTGSLGEAMRAYRSFTIPGIDMLCDGHEYTTAKQAQSAAHQYGREGVMSELYGVTGWDFDFRGHKQQGDWQAALGITLRVPHLSWVSMKGDAKRDYPASINYQSSWYKEYSYVEDHFARVNTALTRGKPVVKVGVIHPVETYWLNYGPSENTAAKRNALDEQFAEICDWLIAGTIDFDYICESLLPEQSVKIGDTLSVGEMDYSVILVSGCETLRSTTVEILNRFVKAGGKVVFVGSAPKYMDAKPSDEPKKLFELCGHTQHNRTDILGSLESGRMIDIKDNSGSPMRNFCYQMRKDNDCLWLFIAHKNYESECENLVWSRKAKITVKGEYTPVLYDTLNGEIKNIDFEIINGKTVIYYDFYRNDSLLLKLEDVSARSYSSEKEDKTLISTEYVTDMVDYKRSEDNVLILDIAEYHPDDENFRPREELRKIQNNVKAQYGLVNNQTQPWTIEAEIPEHWVTLRYTFFSEIEVENAHLALEDAALSEITFNGEKISNETDGYFTDKSVETVKLPQIKKGENVLLITLPITNRSTVENCFILGDFNVRVEGIRKTITAPADKIGFGNIVMQGLPFYGADIDYSMNIEAPCDCSAVIAVRNYKGAVMRVKLDGKDLGVIAYSPYEIDTGKLSKGTHKLTITLYGNRNNCFGPLHNTDDKLGWIGPDAWEFMSDNQRRWKYEYTLKPVGILAGPEIKYYK